MPKLSWSRKRCPYCGSFVKEDAPYCPQCNKPLLVLGNADVSQIHSNLLVDKSREVVQNWLNLHHACQREGFIEKLQQKPEKENKDVLDQVILASRSILENLDDYDDISGIPEELILVPESISPQDFSNQAQQLSQASEKVSSLLAKAKEIGALKMLAYLGVIGNAARLMMPAISQNLPEGTGRPEAVIGAVPIYNFRRKERARSDRKVKYRAIGDVFLAHQEGTKDSLRLDGRLTGPLRYIYLWALHSLQEKGQMQIKKITGGDLGLNFNVDNIPQNFLSEAQSKTEKEELNYEFHHTFPIITRFAIMFDMYLQTIEWHRTLETGKETIDFHLLFRKWIPNTAYKIFNPKFDKNGNLKGEIKLQLLTEDRYKWTKFIIDAIWKGIWAAGEICPRLLFGIEEESIRDLDRSAWSDVGKLVKSYNGTKFLGKNFFEKMKFVDTLVF